MPVQSESYWLGSLAMTITLATQDPDPKPILRSSIKEFLADQGNTELARLLRQTLKEKR